MTLKSLPSFLPGFFFLSASRSPPLVHHHFPWSPPSHPPYRSWPLVLPPFLSIPHADREPRRRLLPSRPFLAAAAPPPSRLQFAVARLARGDAVARLRGDPSPSREGSRTSRLRSVIAAAGAAHVGPEIRNLPHHTVSPYPALRPRSSWEDSSCSLSNKVATGNGCYSF
jgi:hypothetical protein